MGWLIYPLLFCFLLSSGHLQEMNIILEQDRKLEMESKVLLLQIGNERFDFDQSDQDPNEWS